jgi:hypothetical protein
VIAHVVIVPMAPPKILAGVPGMTWMAPNGLGGLAPTVGIVPGTAAGDVMDMAGDVVRIASVLGADVNATCAKVERQPNKTMAAAVTKTMVRMSSFLSLTRQNGYR